MKILFEIPPTTWGLRGDPKLWQAMKEYFNAVQINSVEELEQEFYLAFEKITGHKLERNTDFKIDQFNTGGMSGGMISANFWLDTALPLLTSRFTATH